MQHHLHLDIFFFNIIHLVVYAPPELPALGRIHNLPKSHA
jgi:hypothetical protein